MSSRSPLRLPTDALHHLKALATHIHAIHETLKHKCNPPLQHTTAPCPCPFPKHTLSKSHSKSTVISPSHKHTHSPQTLSLTPPTLPLTIVSVCCSLYLMHAGPPQSGHGCPERQVCDLPTLVLWFFFGWNLVVSLVKVTKCPGCFLTDRKAYWYKSVPLTPLNCAFSVVPIVSWCSTHLEV